MKFYIILILTSLLTLSSSIIYSQEREKIPLSISPVKAFTIPANRILVGGTVEAHKSVVLSAQIPGRIVIISGEEGDHFKQGDLLVKINDDELLAKRQTAVAQFATAASAVNNAGVQFRRQIVSPSTTKMHREEWGCPVCLTRYLPILWPA